MDGIYFWANIEPRNNSTLFDEQGLWHILLRLARKLKLQARKKFIDRYPGEGGFTLVLTIAESHMVIETWPEKKAFRLTVESCRWIDQEEILAAIRSLVEANYITGGMIDRKFGKVL